MSLDKLKSLVLLSRPYNASVFLLTFSIGYFWNGPEHIGNDFFAGLAIMLLMHSFATIQNDIEDLAIDKSNGRISGLQSKLITLDDARSALYLLATGTLLCALLAPSVLHGWFVLILLSLIWLYNKPPFYFSRKPHASIAVMLACYGLLPLLYGYALSGHTATASFLWFLLPWTVLRASISIMKDFKDAPGDKVHGKWTFYLRHGRRLTTRLGAWGAVFGYSGVLLVVFRALEFEPAIAVLFVALVLLALRAVDLRLKMLRLVSEAKLNMLFGKSLVAQNQFELTLAICLMLS